MPEYLSSEQVSLDINYTTKQVTLYLKVRNGFGTATLNVTLKAGANTLRVGHATATAPVVDVLTLKLIGESGISALAPASDHTAYYTLSGVKATNPEPSEVYIHGGRKVLVRK